MCVFICYCDVNIRCKFINIFQSAVIYQQETERRHVKGENKRFVAASHLMWRFCLL